MRRARGALRPSARAACAPPPRPLVVTRPRPGSPPPSPARASAVVIHSGRTADRARFARHARSWLAAFNAGRALYGSLAAREDRFNVRRARERAFHRVCQLLSQGHTTVAPGAARRLPTNIPRGRPECAPPPPGLTVIGWGSASCGFNSPRSRKHGLGPTRVLHRFMRATYPSIHLFAVDECRTSNVCTRCWRVGKKVHPTLNGTVAPHKLLACTGCAPQLIVDRDVSAAVAIMAVLLERLFANPSVTDDPTWPGGGGEAPDPAAPRPRRRSPSPDRLWGPGTSASWHKRRAAA